MRRLPKGLRTLREHEAGLVLVRNRADGPYRSVLVAVDLDAGCEALLEAAHQVAPAARITAVHAYDVPYEGAMLRAGVRTSEIEHHRGRALAEAVERIEEMAVRVAGAGHRVLALVERGHPVPVVLEAAHAMGADLLVVAQRRRPLFERVLLGSIARQLVARATCDVLVADPLPQRLPPVSLRPLGDLDRAPPARAPGR